MVFLCVHTVLIISQTSLIEADFLHGLHKKNQKKLVRSFNFTFHYVDDFISLNSSRFGDYVVCLYPIVPQIKDTADTDRFASYLDKHF